MVDQNAELQISRGELKEIVETHVEIPPETLFKSIQRVLEVRGGDRWRKLTELVLHTQGEIRVIIGWHEPFTDETWQTAWMDTREPDLTVIDYHVRYHPDESYYELGSFDYEKNEFNEISNSGHLASARLLSILSDAHMNTPLEELPDNAYEP